MTLSLKEPCVFPFLLTIRSEKKTSTVGTFGVKLKSDYMCLCLFKLAC